MKNRNKEKEKARATTIWKGERNKTLGDSQHSDLRTVSSMHGRISTESENKIHMLFKIALEHH